MLRAASELGFSPAARPRLAPGQAAHRPEDEPWVHLRLLQGGKDAAG
jgi:phage terminase small subunit